MKKSEDKIKEQKGEQPTHHPEKPHPGKDKDAEKKQEQDENEGEEKPQPEVPNLEPGDDSDNNKKKIPNM